MTLGGSARQGSGSFKFPPGQRTEWRSLRFVKEREKFGTPAIRLHAAAAEVARLAARSERNRKVDLPVWAIVAVGPEWIACNPVGAHETNARRTSQFGCSAGARGRRRIGFGICICVGRLRANWFRKLSCRVGGARAYVRPIELGVRCVCVSVIRHFMFFFSFHSVCQCFQLCFCVPSERTSSQIANSRQR